MKPLSTRQPLPPQPGGCNFHFHGEGVWDSRNKDTAPIRSNHVGVPKMNLFFSNRVSGPFCESRNCIASQPQFGRFKRESHVNKDSELQFQAIRANRANAMPRAANLKMGGWASRSGLVLPFWSLFVMCGIFPICPFPLSRPIGAFPDKSGKPCGLETPRLSFSQLCK